MTTYNQKEQTIWTRSHWKKNLETKKEETAMERKIGEIFEINGEWYQCVVGNGCENCAFNERKCYAIVYNRDPIGDCCADRRKDNKEVIFKKLEKVGEPIIYMSKTFQRLKSPDAKPCKYCYFGNKVCNPHLCEEGLFLVETAMERKIGEIFEYNDEWYQTIETPIDEHSCNGCQGCKGVGIPRIFGGECNGNARKDGKFVIFKKLKKIGEPFTIVGRLYQYYKVFDIDNVCGDGFWCVHNYKTKTLTIEIKQNKEDMEEKELKTKKIIDKLIDDYKARIITYDEFIKVVKSFYADGDKSKPTLKEFDLESAKSGKPVCTRDGRKVRIICFDRKDVRPIVALIKSDYDGEGVYYYYVDGSNLDNYPSAFDLMMLSEKKEGWVNVYKGGLLDTKSYNTKEEAFDKASPRDYVDTVKINWEE